MLIRTGSLDGILLQRQLRDDHLELVRGCQWQLVIRKEPQD